MVIRVRCALRLACCLLLLLAISCSAVPKPATETEGRIQDPALSKLMRVQINQPFSHVVFLLFHAQEDALEDLPDVSQQLVEACTDFTSWDDLRTVSPQGKEVFHDYAVQLESAMVKLDRKIRDEDFDAARAAFEPVQRACDGCHHYFRYDEPVVPGELPDKNKKRKKRR